MSVKFSGLYNIRVHTFDRIIYLFTLLILSKNHFWFHVSLVPHLKILEDLWNMDFFLCKTSILEERGCDSKVGNTVIMSYEELEGDMAV
ncbi:hypothetical protein QVD17_30163 [Tagetes erecta]|uniref:Uncharacterized protein n=1 Tax=Tagetes erecta TaxID=13708 RepID=A0AAD8K289_TARER|nr:hypothetical protein QVD17_30163 [Tagetes erecta]